MSLVHVPAAGPAAADGTEGAGAAAGVSAIAHALEEGRRLDRLLSEALRPVTGAVNPEKEAAEAAEIEAEMEILAQEDSQQEASELAAAQAHIRALEAKLSRVGSRVMAHFRRTKAKEAAAAAVQARTVQSLRTQLGRTVLQVQAGADQLKESQDEVSRLRARLEGPDGAAPPASEGGEDGGREAQQRLGRASSIIQSAYPLVRVLLIQSRAAGMPPALRPSVDAMVDFYVRVHESVVQGGGGGGGEGRGGHDEPRPPACGGAGSAAVTAAMPAAASADPRTRRGGQRQQQVLRAPAGSVTPTPAPGLGRQGSQPDGPVAAASLPAYLSGPSAPRGAPPAGRPGGSSRGTDAAAGRASAGPPSAAQDVELDLDALEAGADESDLLDADGLPPVT